MGYFDFHTHILFDVDHGVQTFEEAIQLLKIYKDQNFDTVALTPHIYHPTVSTKVQNIRINFERLKDEASKIGIDILLGSELYLEAQTQINTIPIAGKFALIEFPTLVKPVDLESKLNNVIEQNLQPIIAHIERYQWLKPDSSEMKSLLFLGCLLSVNVEGIENHTANKYLEKGLIDIIASDNHGDKNLPVKLNKILENNPKIKSRMDAIVKDLR